MNNELLKNANDIDQLKNSIQEILLKIKQDYENNIIYPINLYDLNELLDEILLRNNIMFNIHDLITIEYLFFFRIILIYEKKSRIIILQILRNCIKINPLFTNNILEAMIPIIICKIFEDKNSSSFEERYICLKFCLTWLKLSDTNFPIIFPQAIASIAKTDDPFKIGCIEFLREMSISRPDLCSTVGGFRILINSFLEDTLPKNLVDKIIDTLRYIINTPNKRKYFNGFGDFYKIYSIFTKSDFSSGEVNKIEIETRKQREEIKEETERLEMQLDSANYFIKKFLITWPGYFLLMNDPLIFGSICQSLNNDVSIIIKKSILKLFKDILEASYNILDNFNKVCSDDKDIFYINKFYLAYIIQGFYDNHLNENLFEFIESNENSELKEYAFKLAIKYNILFTKLVNHDFHSPYAKEKIEKIKWYDNIKHENTKFEEGGYLKNNNFSCYVPDFEKQKAAIKIKIMHIQDVIFHHLNCRDTPILNNGTISPEVIIAIHGMLNLDYIKQYENQYSIENSKKELYSKDEEFIEILKNSKVIELKEFNLWDWTQIDFLLDLIEIKKELIPELNKQKFFKKLLFSYSPSKNLIVKQSWTINNFYYGAIGNKLFKILVKQEDLSILDLPNEDYLFQKTNSWIKDVMNCLESLLDQNIPENHPFTIKRINNTLSRNIFIFIGIISNTTKGDKYLYKQGFYSLLDKFINQNNRFDYLLTIIIDNLNFISKYVNIWIQNVLENGNNQIKKYILNHIRSLIILGKEIIIDVKVIFKALNPDFPDCNKIIISIIKILINNGKNISHIFKDESMIEKVKQIDKSLLYILMRDPIIYDYLIDIINKEVDNINIDEIIEQYGNQMNESMIESFKIKEEQKKKFYLTINLSQIYNRYNFYYEYFWIKQLPFNVVLQTIEEKDQRNEFILNNYMEYDCNKIIIISQPQYTQKIIFDDSISGIQIICFLGRITINKNSSAISNASNFLTFYINEILKEMTPYDKSKNIFQFQKDGINLVLKQIDNQNSFILEKIFFNIIIRPDIIEGFKTPINLITELNNNKKGFEKLVQINAVEKLFSYFENIGDKEIDKNSKKIKSCLWIINKLTLKKVYGKMLQDKYNIISRIKRFYDICNDYSMKGTIIYLISCSVQNKELKPIINSCHHNSYFFNTDICFPSEKSILYIDKTFSYENEQLNKDINIIKSKISLNPISEKIYNNVINLINNITFKQSIINLDDLYRINKYYFCNANLFIKIYSILTKYKLTLSARRAIMLYFEKCIYSSEIAFECSKLLKNLEKNILNAHELK